ncbi:3'-5' exonuclease domain-containing protein 2 [Acinetobacter sp. NIPH 2699]|uniref:3'-5' exonuclease n=1 Tax=Acinetobacter sp. NIPH 2699 TaxID=2923433 RepID=UPI001F4B8B3B|nr:3'-5' exonuclease domain-containing protein 2 [Acinetobacter sp. NIPH 2699]MCH7335777.1 3'-5' exonuclease domain-containing protein 2 [Acinetobacter sp. NIPH 2699]
MEMQQPMIPLTKEQIRALPAFQNLNHENILVIQTLEQCLAVQAELNAILIFGFDTESKPTFKVGEKSTGPHLIQLATHDKAYLFQVTPEILNFLKPILESEQQLKVGFGLKNDASIFRAKGIEPKQLIELSKSFASFGYRTQVGIQTAVALLFHRYFAKSKKISTSNWSVKQLSPQQIAYATADAYTALLIFEHLYQHRLLSPQQQQIIRILKGSTSKA